MADRIVEFLVPFIQHYGYWILFGLTMLETSAFLGLVAPGETIIVLCAFYASRGTLDVWTVWWIAMAGAILGDQLGYALGRHYGHGLIQRFGKYVFFDTGKLERTERYYDRHGGKTVFIGRFMSLLRSFGPVVAGVSRMPYGTFLAWSVASVVVWATAFTVVGYFFGKSWEAIEEWMGWGGAAAFVVGFALVLWFLHHKREEKFEEEFEAEEAGQSRESKEGVP